MKNSEERLSFGGFTLDLRRHALFRGAARVRLTPKPLEALIVLVERRGQVVSKDALLGAVWKDVAVTEGVLVQAVREIRRALDDDKEDPTFVQTVPREGYRFVGDVVIEETAIQPTPVPRPPTSSASTRRLGVLITVAAVVLAAIAWRAWTSGRQARLDPSISAGESPARVAALTAASISAVKPSFSPDGRTLLYLSDDPDVHGVLDLFLLPLSGGNPLRLTHLVNASGDLPVFTADGREIVFSRYRTGAGGSGVPDLWRVSAFGGTPVRYIPEASGAGFSPDGAWVAYTKHEPGGRTLVVSPADRIGDGREVSNPGFTPRWSPDGRWLAYTTSYPEGGDGDLWIVSTTFAERRRLTHEPHQLYGLTWSPDSRSIIFAAKIGNAFHLWRVSLAQGSIESLTTGVGEYVSPTISPDGRQLAFTLVRPVRDLILAPASDAPESGALTNNEYHRWPRFSPSGRRIASVVQRTTPDDYLYVTNVETKESRRVSDVPAEYPSWIDEDLIGYLARTRDGSTEIRRVHLTSGENSTVARLASPASWLAVRPGAAEAAFVASSGDRKRIVLRDLATGRESIVAEAAELEDLRWRPDGKALAWSGPRVWADTRTNGVHVVEPGRSAPRLVVADGFGPVWAADDTLFFARYFGEHDEAGVWRIDAATGVEAQVRRLVRIDYFDVAGSSLVLARSTGRSQVFAMPMK